MLSFFLATFFLPSFLSFFSCLLSFLLAYSTCFLSLLLLSYSLFFFLSCSVVRFTTCLLACLLLVNFVVVYFFLVLCFFSFVGYLFVLFASHKQICTRAYACMHAHIHTCTHIGRVSARGRFVVRTLVAGSSCARSWPVRRVCARGRFVVCALVAGSLCAATKTTVATLNSCCGTWETRRSEN